jgi:hypothetical protein
VLSILGVPVQTPSPRLLPQEAYTAAIPHHINDLNKQAEHIKRCLKRRTQSPPSPVDQALRQLYKGCQMAIHGAAVLARQNKQLLAENRHQKAKRVKKRSYITKGGIYTGAEAQGLVEKANNGSEEAEVDSSGQARQRAPPKCSLCSSLKHKAPKCPKQQTID